MSKIKIFSLGGLNELGKNMYVVEVNDDIFVFDAGLKYADDSMLGVDYVIPNYDYLKQNRKRIKGIFISHGHEKQMGALCDILLDLKDVKVYGTHFTLEIIKNELLEDKISTKNLVEIEPYVNIKFKDNSIFPISLTHDVPDTVGYVLNTKDGAIVYTGNFVFDSSMLGPYKTDIGSLAYVGKKGVLCLLSESIYADKPGFTAPSHRIGGVLKETLTLNDGKRVLFNVLKTQLYRIQELLTAIENMHRDVVIMGKGLEKLILDSIDSGYIKFDKKRIKTLKDIDNHNIVVIVSDEREKPFSNLNRIVKGYDKFVKLSPDDVIIFATPISDELEKASTRLFDDISRIGCALKVISNRNFRSFHASREDLMLMLDLMQPKYYFPICGEYRHQVANKDIAKMIGMDDEHILLCTNGKVVTFENGNYVDTGEVIPTGEILIDGKTVGDIGELVLKDRELLSDNGIVIVTATLDKATKEILAGPEILTRGFIYVKESTDIIKEATNISLEVLENNITHNYVDYTKVRNDIREALGSYLYQETECKPMILLVIQEV
ncbi:MAG: ribonuclease J [Bacilli bacterium]|nr:ribonuclease J [Bacilli bacterium]